MSIIYTSNKEYRQAIRNFCDMSCNDISSDYENIDDESCDELLYDPDSMEEKMKEIYEKTRGDSLWIHLYELAAAKFFSIEKEIGIAVLLSYDYFPAFYECWNSFSQTPERWSKTNEYYTHLLSIL